MITIEHLNVFIRNQCKIPRLGEALLFAICLPSCLPKILTVVLENAENIKFLISTNHGLGEILVTNSREPLFVYFKCAAGKQNITEVFLRLNT